ncbi:hypothetical protein [uncultured Mobiluncus sp.]|uniref:hypothetical protein n=1 Tax=uncultured Mobiluncus sp. TaxID=293425 RepID=UPI00288A1765|nr:hypothetical protein [uncultured Mobiluncus sp.]
MTPGFYQEQKPLTDNLVNKCLKNKESFRVGFPDSKKAIKAQVGAVILQIPKIVPILLGFVFKYDT